MLRLTVSTTSTNASFFLYLTSPRRQLVAPVACTVILEDSSYTDPVSGTGCPSTLLRTGAIFDDMTLSVVMYDLSVSASLF